MPAPPERGNLHFDPPIKHGSERYHRMWELLSDMGMRRAVVFHYKGHMDLHDLSFPTKALALMFKLRL